MAIARDAECPVCGLVYDEMKTGLTYRCIYSMLWSASPDTTTWRYKRRNTVLGLWHSIKREQWEAHLKECEEYQHYLGEVLLDEEEAWAEREAKIAADLLPDMASTPVEGVPFRCAIVDRPLFRPCSCGYPHSYIWTGCPKTG